VQGIDAGFSIWGAPPRQPPIPHLPQRRAYRGAGRGAQCQGITALEREHRLGQGRKTASQPIPLLPGPPSKPGAVDQHPRLFLGEPAAELIVGIARQWRPTMAQGREANLL